VVPTGVVCIPQYPVAPGIASVAALKRVLIRRGRLGVPRRINVVPSDGHDWRRAKEEVE
jgi:hypothetical protein